MNARLQMLAIRTPRMVRVSMVLLSLLALALGAGAPDDWGGHGGWVRLCW